MAAHQRTSSRTFIACSVVSALLGLSGCVSYTNVPEPTSAPAFESANNTQSIRATRAALEEVVYRYPMRDAQGRYSVNLPAGTTLESAIRIIEGLPEGMVLPHEGMDDSIPMYHIGRIWIRANDAKVDVLYPARAFDGSAFTGTVTVWLRGGMVSWRVTRVQHWAPGTIATPPVYVPLPEEAIVAREMMGEGPDRESAATQEPAASEEPMVAPEPETEPELDVEVEPAPKPEAKPDPGAMYRQVPIDD